MRQYTALYQAHLIKLAPENHTAQDRILVKVSDDSNHPSEFRVVLFEPITAALVCMWLAQGAVAYLGGLALGSVLGHPSLSDVASMLRKAVEEIKTFAREELKRQIEENELRNMAAQLDSAVRNLKQYDLYPEDEKQNARFLLEDALIKSGEVMSLASRFEINGAFIFANAVSVRSLSHIAMKKAGLVSANDPLLDTLKEGKGTLERIMLPHRQSWEPDRRLSQPEIRRWEGGGPGGWPVIYVWCIKDGREITSGDIGHGPGGVAGIQERADKFWQQIYIEVAAEYRNVMDRTEVPLMAVLNEWEKLKL